MARSGDRKQKMFQVRHKKLREICLSFWRTFSDFCCDQGDHVTTVTAHRLSPKRLPLIFTVSGVNIFFSVFFFFFFPQTFGIDRFVRSTNARVVDQISKRWKRWKKVCLIVTFACLVTYAWDAVNFEHASLGSSDTFQKEANFPRRLRIDNALKVSSRFNFIAWEGVHLKGSFCSKFHQGKKVNNYLDFAIFSFMIIRCGILSHTWFSFLPRLLNSSLGLQCCFSCTRWWMKNCTWQPETHTQTHTRARNYMRTHTRSRAQIHTHTHTHTHNLFSISKSFWY